jgi:hypothetical protein
MSFKEVLERLGSFVAKKPKISTQNLPIFAKILSFKSLL